MKHRISIKSNEFISESQIKRVIKTLKKVKPRKGFYEIWLSADSKSAKAIDYEIKKQLKE